MNNTIIGYTSNYKYLGLMLNKTLTMIDHANGQVGIVANKIKTLGIIRSLVNTEVALLIYKTLILPLFEYVNLIHVLIPKQI